MSDRGSSRRKNVSTKVAAFCSTPSTRNVCQLGFYLGLLGYIFLLGRTSVEVPNDITNLNNLVSSSGSISTSNMKREDAVVFGFASTVNSVAINVGSNIDPIILTEEYGPCSPTIAVEPVVGCRIKKHPQINVLHAAVSENFGILSMKMYNKNGRSSSLARPSGNLERGVMDWNKKWKGNSQVMLVPVIPLSSILYAIPKHTKIQILMTDIQGYDFSAIKAAGPALLERVTHMVTEVWLDDMHTYDLQNDLCRDFLPFMTNLGYTLVELRENYKDDYDVAKISARCERQMKARPKRPKGNETVGLNEADAFWVRNDAIGQKFPSFKKFPSEYTPPFTRKEYEQCEF